MKSHCQSKGYKKFPPEAQGGLRIRKVLKRWAKSLKEMRCMLGMRNGKQILVGELYWNGPLVMLTFTCDDISTQEIDIT
jgi:hypothetical protein